MPARTSATVTRARRRRAGPRQYARHLLQSNAQADPIDRETDPLCGQRGSRWGRCEHRLRLRYRVGRQLSSFIQAFSKIGLVPDAGGSWSLARILGEPRAKALALLAEPLDAETAADWGLIWKAVPDGTLMAEASALATRLAVGPTRGLGLTKRAIQAAAANSFDTHLDLERDLQREPGTPLTTPKASRPSWRNASRSLREDDDAAFRRPVAGARRGLRARDVER